MQARSDPTALDRAGEHMVPVVAGHKPQTSTALWPMRLHELWAAEWTPIGGLVNASFAAAK